MILVERQIYAALKMMNIYVYYEHKAHKDNLYLRPTGSILFKTGIYTPEEGIAFLLKHYESTTIQKQEINND